MCKRIVCNVISIDGYYEGPSKDVMALPFDEAFDDYNAERLRAANTLLLGRRSFEGYSSEAAAARQGEGRSDRHSHE